MPDDMGDAMGDGTGDSMGSGSSGSPSTAPTITALSPASVPAGSAAFLLAVTGTGFVSGSVVTVGADMAPPQAIVSGTQIVALVVAADVAVPGSAAVVAANVNGSATATLLVTADAPSILSPTAILLDSAYFRSGDSYPLLAGRLVDANSVAVNLAGAAATGSLTAMWDPSIVAALMVSVAADPATGYVSFPPPSNLDDGPYLLVIDATWPNGLVTSFPDSITGAPMTVARSVGEATVGGNDSSPAPPATFGDAPASLANAGAVGPGVWVRMPRQCQDWTLQVNVASGSPTVIACDLEVSLDGVNPTWIGTWTLGTNPGDKQPGQALFVADSPANYVRANLTALDTGTVTALVTGA